MAKSTAIVIAAGALTATDLILTDYDPKRMMTVSVATVGAAIVSAGLDKIVPGFGTGAAAVLFAAVLFKSGPRIIDKLDLMKEK